MALLSELVDRHGGGLLHKQQLVRLGASDHHLTHAVRSGDVRRARRGWYTTFAPTDPRFIAVRVGGRLTGASALALLGAWQLDDRPPITVSVPKNAARLRRRKGVRVVYDDSSVTSRGLAWAVHPLDALREAVLESTFEDAVALLDWAWHTGVAREDDLQELVNTLPQDLAGILAWADEKCESYLESIARTRLLRLGYSVTSQEPVNGRQRIDLVVDDVVGLELDGRRHHESTFEEDRTKDLIMVEEGRIAMRASYSIVQKNWGLVVRALDAALLMHRRGGESRPENSGHLRLLPPCKGRRWRLPRQGRPRWPEKPRQRPAKARRRPTATISR